MHYLKIKKTLILFLVFWVISAIFAHSIQANSVNKSAVVLLIAKDSAGEVLGTGTGFIVKPEGTLVLIIMYYSMPPLLKLSCLTVIESK